MYCFFQTVQELCEAAKRYYGNTMMSWMKYLGVFAVLLTGTNAWSQTESETSGGEYLQYQPSEYSEVFGVSRGSFGGNRDYVLPENREQWLEVAEKISRNQIDEKVYYAFFRGELPSDIFTPEFLAANEKHIDNWLLEKWAHLQDEPEEEPVVVSVGPFVAYPEGAGESLGQYPRRIKCDPFFSGASRENKDRPVSKKIKAIRLATQNAIACEHSDRQKD